MATRVLLIGGYGFFGERLATLLGAHANLDIVIAGRSLEQARTSVDAHRKAGAIAAFESCVLDTGSDNIVERIRDSKATVVVNLAGPFQGKLYALARACIAARVHYIDIADARDFVCGIGELDAQARAAGVSVVSGASSVPALSSAAIDHLAPAFFQVHHIDIGISPGNRTDRGLATVRAILSYCGEPIRVWRNARWSSALGWLRQGRHRYPAPVGARWLTLCEVPDLQLQPTRYPHVRSVNFRAGLEVSLLHWGLACASALRCLRLLPSLQHMARFAKWASDGFIGWGSDAGAMHVQLTGITHDGQTSARRWTLLAVDGDGPYVPVLGAAALVHRIANGTLPSGARPCTGLLTLADFQLQIGELAIRFQEEVA